jgi:crossover junction endodeoxyribonuclease RusA
VAELTRIPTADAWLSLDQASAAQYPVVATVLGDPVQQGSKRAIVNQHTGRAALVESAARRLKPWRRLVADALRLAADDAGVTCWDCPVAVRVAFTMAEPKRPKFPGRPAVKPDVDKLLRAVLDALTMSGVVKDDARVVELDRVVKCFPGQDAESLQEPGVRISVRQLDVMGGLTR